MKKNKKRIYIVVLLLVAVLAFLAYRYWNGGETTTVQIETTKLSNKDIVTTVTATGTVEPVDQVDVGTQVSGLVQKIFVDFNTTVKKGQLLAELDKTNLNESVSNAQAAYNAALNEVSYYQQNYDRQKKMYDAQVISKADFEQSLYQLNNAKATAVQRKTALSQSRTNLGYANIYSPIDGVILSKEVEEGQTVAASMSTPTLFTIAKDITKMQVEADVDEADIGNVQEGQRVSFTVDAYPEKTFSGLVKQVRLGATTTSNVVTYTVIILADNSEQKLKPGLTATITIYTQELANVLSLPASAFSFSPDESLLQQYYAEHNIKATMPVIRSADSGRHYVWIRNNDGSLVQKEVEKGVGDGINVAVSAGLGASDLVVVGMQQQTAKSATGAKSSQSPFMPKRPDRGNKKANAR